jgi:hypothetical protein
VAAGLAGGSGRVAVGGADGGWQCGHFEGWKVWNRGFIERDRHLFYFEKLVILVILVILRGVCGSGCWVSGWQWQGGSVLVGWGVAVRSF